MKYVILFLLLSACTRADLKDNAFGDPVTEAPANTTNPPKTISVVGDWYYVTTPLGGPSKPQGLSITFDSFGGFTKARFFNGLSAGGAPAYIIVKYGGSYKIENSAIILTYEWPTCMSTTPVVMPIKEMTEGMNLTVDIPGATSPTTFTSGSIISKVEALKPIETASCKYALIDKEEKRAPASVKVR